MARPFVAAIAPRTTERGVELGRLPRRQAEQRRVEPFDQPFAADLVRQAGRGAVFDRLPVDAQAEVDADEVAGLDRPLDRRQRPEAVGERLQLLIDVRLGDLGIVDGDRQLGEFGQFNSGPDVDLRRKRQLLAVREAGHFDLGLAEHPDVGRLDRLPVELRDRVVDGLVEDHVATDSLVDDAGRNLAGPKTRDPDLPGDLAVGGVDARRQLLEGHLDSELDPGRTQRLDFALHGRLLLGWISAGHTRGTRD